MSGRWGFGHGVIRLVAGRGVPWPGLARPAARGGLRRRPGCLASSAGRAEIG
ncbi:hypothetical protein SFR_4951 [Streptomyces sp. FR-008]|nr:hypothetical protein SFR_4951 [Streptomyces sp. FR-008]